MSILPEGFQEGPWGIFLFRANHHLAFHLFP